MRVINIGALFIILLMATPIYAAKSTTRMSVQARSQTADSVDTIPPAIVITSPEVQRGLKVTAREASVTVTGRATDAAGVASVTINGQLAALDANGNFSAELLLKVGENQILVTATDVNRNQATERFTMVRQAGTVAVAKKEAPAPAPAADGKNYALIIGINQYKYIDKLRTAVGDAQDVAGVLKELYGFETRLILDGKATHDAILKELNSLRAKLKPTDRLLIYYAGHGTLDKETDASYWLPVDAELNDDTNWLDTKRITDQLKRITARQVLVVADSCYSGTISRAIDPNLQGNDTRENYLKKLQDKPSRILIASGGNEPVADAGGKGHSVFAEVFINTLKNPDRSVFTGAELLTNRIREAVAGRAEQTPEYKVIRNSGHDGGDFVFVKRK